MLALSSWSLTCSSLAAALSNSEKASMPACRIVGSLSAADLYTALARPSTRVSISCKVFTAVTLRLISAEDARLLTASASLRLWDSREEEINFCRPVTATSWDPRALWIALSARPVSLRIVLSSVSLSPAAAALFRSTFSRAYFAESVCASAIHFPMSPRNCIALS